MDKELSPVTIECRRRLSRICLAFFAFFAVTLVLQFLIVFFAGILRPAWMAAPMLTWIESLVPMYCFGLPVFYMILRPLPTAHCGGRRISGLDLAVLFFIAFAVMYVTNLLATGINLLTDTILGRSSTAGATELINESPLYLTVIFAVLLGPAVEEFMFRRLLLSRLLPFGEGFAILTSALLFGLFHANLAQFLYAFAIGLILATVTCRTGRLRYTVILHVLLNFFGSIPATLLARKTAELGINDMDEAALLESPEALVTMLLASGYSLLLLAAVVSGLLLLATHVKRMLPRPTGQPIPRGERRHLWLSAGTVLYALMLLFLFATSYL